MIKTKIKSKAITKSKIKTKSTTKTKTKTKSKLKCIFDIHTARFHTCRMISSSAGHAQMVTSLRFQKVATPRYKTCFTDDYDVDQFFFNFNITITFTLRA